MTTEQINILIENGFSIGGHSIGHPKLQELSHNNQIKQIEESIKFINSKFNTGIRSLHFHLQMNFLALSF